MVGTGAFSQILTHGPELAEKIAAVLTHRQVQLDEHLAEPSARSQRSSKTPTPSPCWNACSSSSPPRASEVWRLSYFTPAALSSLASSPFACISVTMSQPPTNLPFT